MSKRLAALLLALVIALSAATAAAAGKVIGPDAGEVFLAYQNPYFDMEIEYPPAWSVREGFMGGLVAFVSPLEPGNDQFSENVNVVVEDLANRPGMTAEGYANACLGPLAKAATDFKLTDRRNVTISGRPAVMIEYTWRQGVFQLHVLQTMIVANGKGYVTTFTAEETSFARYKPVGLQIINSLEIAED